MKEILCLNDEFKFFIVELYLYRKTIFVVLSNWKIRVASADVKNKCSNSCFPNTFISSEICILMFCKIHLVSEG